MSKEIIIFWTTWKAWRWGHWWRLSNAQLLCMPLVSSIHTTEPRLLITALNKWRAKSDASLMNVGSQSHAADNLGAWCGSWSAVWGDFSPIWCVLSMRYASLENSTYSPHFLQSQQSVWNIKTTLSHEWMLGKYKILNCKHDFIVISFFFSTDAQFKWQ